MSKDPVGILSTGVYIPEKRMTAADIAAATEGEWTAKAVKEKLGIIEKPVPGPEDGTDEMGVKAAQQALEKADITGAEIDLILWIGEEWKEYPMTTSGIYLHEKIGAGDDAWAVDVQQKCGTTAAAMKMAKDMIRGNQNLETVLIAGGYRNEDLIDYSDPALSMMYNLAAGGGAVILQQGYNQNVLLGSHLMCDGSLARDVGVKYGGVENPVNADNLEEAYKLKILNLEHMKKRLKEVSMSNWFYCIEQAFKKAGLAESELDYLAVLHFKRSMHQYMLEELNLTEENTTYLSQYGHMGQFDPILSLNLGLEQGKIKDGSIVSMIAAGIGYSWSANVIRWGKPE